MVHQAIVAGGVENLPLVSQPSPAKVVARRRVVKGDFGRAAPVLGLRQSKMQGRAVVRRHGVVRHHGFQDGNVAIVDLDGTRSG